jgi:hypothetical protein
MSKVPSFFARPSFLSGPSGLLPNKAAAELVAAVEPQALRDAGSGSAARSYTRGTCHVCGQMVQSRADEMQAQGKA